MGKLSLMLIVVGTAACGSDANKTPDATIVVPDTRPIDAPKVFMDAPPPSYDFTCYNGTPATTATDPITISGTTSELTQNGLTATNGVSVSFFKTGTATAIATVTSAGGGLFASGNIATGGTPIDAYIGATLDAARTTYLYPPNPASKSLANVPVPIVTNSTFSLVKMFAQATQDDTTSGALLLILSDCAQTPIDGATVTVQQGGNNVGTQFDLGTLSAMAAGTFFVFNVPDGATTVTAKYGTMTFPVRTVASHKQPANGAASITTTEVLPGPI
jgi:hypothetical protein